MDILRGCVVISSAGHDKGMLFAVLEVSGAYALIANGRLRPLEKPKRKSIKHLHSTKSIIAQDALVTNNKLWRALAKCMQE
jgi:ribosomal protein L14E/L6E/L27E